METKYTVLIDLVGRTVFGEAVESTTDLIKINNPAFINLQPGADGRIQVSVVPMFFKQFAANKDQDVVWSFPAGLCIVPENLQLDDNLIAQYKQIFSPIIQPSAKPSQIVNDPNKTIKLF